MGAVRHAGVFHQLGWAARNFAHLHDGALAGRQPLSVRITGGAWPRRSQSLKTARIPVPACLARPMPRNAAAIYGLRTSIAFRSRQLAGRDVGTSRVPEDRPVPIEADEGRAPAVASRIRAVGLSGSPAARRPPPIQAPQTVILAPRCSRSSRYTFSSQLPPGRMSTGRVQHEVPLSPDELKQPPQVKAFERRNVVVARGPDRTCGVEITHGLNVDVACGGGKRRRCPAPTRTDAPSQPPPLSSTPRFSGSTMSPGAPSRADPGPAGDQRTPEVAPQPRSRRSPSIRSTPKRARGRERRAAAGRGPLACGERAPPRARARGAGLRHAGPAAGLGFRVLPSRRQPAPSPPR